MAYQQVHVGLSDVDRLAANMEAIQLLFPDPANPADGAPQAMWADRMGLAPQMDDRWNYVEQPEAPVFPQLEPAFHNAPIPPRGADIDDLDVQHRPVDNWHPGHGFDLEDDADSESDSDEMELDWDDMELDWESDSGIASGSEASDDSFDDSLSNASITSSTRDPPPNEYIRQLDELEEFEMDLHRGCPHCQLEVFYRYNMYRFAARNHID